MHACTDQPGPPGIKMRFGWLNHKKLMETDSRLHLGPHLKPLCMHKTAQERGVRHLRRISVIYKN